MLRTRRSARTLALLAALACVAVLAVPVGAIADGPASDRSTDHAVPPSTSLSGDSPSDRGRLATTSSSTASSSSSDGGGGLDAGWIVLISLGGLTLAGSAWVLTRRHYHQPLIPRGSH